MRCPECNREFPASRGQCPHCGASPVVGPDEGNLNSAWRDEPAQAAPPLDTAPENPVCPKCEAKYPIFDNWKCKNCGFERSDKAKTAHGRLMSAEEAAEIRKKLFGED